MRAQPVLFLVLLLPTIGCALLSAGSEPSWVITDSETAFKHMFRPQRKGEKIVFIGQSTSPSHDFDVFSMNADGTGLQNLTNTPELLEGDPYWTKDGKIVYRSIPRNAAAGVFHDYYMMDEDGINKQEISGSLYESLKPVTRN